MLCRPARNISMNVPVVVQVARTMIELSATLGPDSQSHQDRSRNSPLSAPGEAWMPNQPSTMWISPSESSSQTVSTLPGSTADSTVLTTPAGLNRNTKMNATAIELVTDGK